MAIQSRYILKRLMDMVISFFLIIFLSPIFVIISALILCNSGRPVFYTQSRLGQHGKEFKILKFRTMANGSDANPVFNPDGSLLILDNDKRITRVGKWLRLFSLDELPQLFNVFAGQMSLVGPRPDLPCQVQFYSDKERQKLNIKPGITGLAQVKGRNLLPWKKRIEFDLYYIENFSLKLDLIILFQTLVRSIKSEGIYDKSAEETEVKHNYLNLGE